MRRTIHHLDPESKLKTVCGLELRREHGSYYNATGGNYVLTTRASAAVTCTNCIRYWRQRNGMVAEPKKQDWFEYGSETEPDGGPPEIPDGTDP